MIKKLILAAGAIAAVGLTSAPAMARPNGGHGGYSQGHGGGISINIGGGHRSRSGYGYSNRYDDYGYRGNGYRGDYGYSDGYGYDRHDRRDRRDRRHHRRSHDRRGH